MRIISCLPIGYNKFLVPPPLRTDERLAVNLSINIEKITIDEVKGFIRTKFTLNIHWFDSRLTYQNLKRNTQNSMYSEDKDFIWKPWIQFENIENLGKVQKTGQQIHTNHNELKFWYKQGRITNLHNALLFEGSEDPLNFERQLTVDWIFELNLAWYPFDSQICNMKIYLNEDAILFTPDILKYKGPGALTQHFVKGIMFCSFPIEDKSGVIVEVELGRPLIRSVLKNLYRLSKLYLYCQDLPLIFMISQNIFSLASLVSHSPCPPQPT